MQYDNLLKLLHNRFSLAIVSLFQVARDIIYTLPVGYRHHDTLINSSLLLIDFLYYRPSHTLYALCLTLESLHSLGESTLAKVVAVATDKLVLGERTFHSKHFQEALFASLEIVCGDNIHDTVPNDIGDIHSDTLTHKGMAAFLVNHGTLFVHHVIIFKKTLTHTEMVLLYLLLRTFNAIRHHRAFNPVAFLESEFVHYRCDALGSEQTHQLIFKRYVEN